jgi:2-polyprenyl-3-methyl-5-hydroxy-6-metoxy-1,4-benzoquinol methylase
MNTQTPAGTCPACPICRGRAAKQETGRWRDPLGGVSYSTLECPDCGVVFADPFRAPGGDWYSASYSAESYATSDPQRFVDFLKMARIAPGSSVLDVGCGAGAFLAAAGRAGLEARGVDINPGAAAAAAKAGLPPVFTGTLKDFAAAAPEKRFDAVTMFDYFEHLDDPVDSLGLAASLLKPEGLLFVSVPNADRPLLFGRDDFDQPPHHLTRWTAAALSRCLEANGFAVEQVRADHLPVWEFSRRAVNGATAAALAAARLLGLAAAPTAGKGKGAADAAPAAPAPSGGLRRAAVRLFQATVAAVSYPVFLPFPFVYRLLRRNCGISVEILARRRAKAG